jgi:integrase
MATRNLTLDAIDALSFDSTGTAWQVLWDSRTPGLGVRVTKSGAKTYVYRYRFCGRQRLISLGKVSLYSGPKEARERADGLERQIKKDGKDPLVEKALRAAVDTIGEMVERYLDDHIARRRAPKTLESYRAILNAYLLPAFGSRKPQELMRPEVRAWHRRLSSKHVSRRDGHLRTRGGPYQANRALQLLRAAFNWIDRQDDGTLPPGFRNPCVGVEANRERVRKVRLDLAELPRVIAEIESVEDPWIKGFYWFLLLTGCRKTEALELKWIDVNLAAGLVKFRGTKNGDDHLLPLSGPAVQLLEQMPRVEDNEHVFCGRFGRGRLIYPDKEWRQIRIRANVGELRLHDLRRSFGSWLADDGFSAEQVGRLLNHRSSITSKVYMQLGDTAKRRGVEHVAGLVSQAVAEQRPVHLVVSADTVPIAKAESRAIALL